MKLTDKIEVFNEDCMEVMKRYPDKYFDLAVVDPPYGIGASTKKFHNGTNGGGNKKWKNATWDKFAEKEWDNNIPDKTYFDLLFVKSKNQIVWGGNYFANYFENKMGWIFWDKQTGDHSYSDGELAWTSFDCAVKKYEYLWSGFRKQRPEKRIQPCQKPIALYDWIFKNYAKQGMKILDTHGGSMSSVISADKAGLEMVCCELDKEYCANALVRFWEHKKQLAFNMEWE